MESAMLKITVSQTTVRELKGVSAKSGKPYHMRFQTGYAWTVDREGNPPPYPEKIELMLGADDFPWAPGSYTLHPSSLYVDQNGRLSCTPRLTPIVAKASSTAAA